MMNFLSDIIKNQLEFQRPSNRNQFIHFRAVVAISVLFPFSTEVTQKTRIV